MPRRSRQKKDSDKKDDDESMVHKVIKSKPKLKFVMRDLYKTEVFKDRGGEKARSHRNGTNYSQL